MSENAVNGLGITMTQVISVFELFNNKRLFEIPNYQRNYAWEYEEIEDFIFDLEECLKAKKENKTLKHFFGSLLTIKKNDSRVNLENRYELIDGQQRITTFYVAIAALVNVMNGIIVELEENESAKEFLLETINDIERDILFVKVRDSISDTNVNTIRRVKFVDRNREYLDRLLKNEKQDTSSETAHVNLKNAYCMFNQFYTKYTTDNNLMEKINKVNQLVEVLLRDFMILNIESENKKNAYTFFKVLNDRGKNLSYIDLIKADTMEYFASDKDNLIVLEASWDFLMKIPNDLLEKYFGILYSYYCGRKLANLKEYELFRKEIFNNFPTAQDYDKSRLLDVIKNIVADIKILKSLCEGEISITNNFQKKSYYEYRLNLLMNKLKNTSSLPLFLAVVKLNDGKAFIKYLEIIEKFYFRYRIICSGHATAMTNVFDNAAKQLYDGVEYKVVLSEMRRRLGKLLVDRANDTIFEVQIKEKLDYEKSDKKIIKYFLLYLDYYNESFKNAEEPIRLLDTTTIVDFDNLTIEHIYNKSEFGAYVISEIEPVKNNIMNLTLLPPLENSDFGRANTSEFSKKKEVYRASAFSLTRDVADITELSLIALNERLEKIILLAKSVFKV